MGYYAQHPDDGPEAREIPVTVRLSVSMTLEVPFIKYDDESDDEVVCQVRNEYDRHRDPERVWKAAKDRTLDDFKVVEIVEEG